MSARLSVAMPVCNERAKVEQSWFFNVLGVAGRYVNSRLLRRRTFPRAQLALYDAPVPLFRVESRFRLPLGTSLIAVARKPAAPSHATPCAR